MSDLYVFDKYKSYELLPNNIEAFEDPYHSVLPIISHLSLKEIAQILIAIDEDYLSWATHAPFKTRNQLMEAPADSDHILDFVSSSMSYMLNKLRDHKDPNFSCETKNLTWPICFAAVTLGRIALAIRFEDCMTEKEGDNFQAIVEQLSWFFLLPCERTATYALILSNNRALDFNSVISSIRGKIGGGNRGKASAPYKKRVLQLYTECYSQLSNSAAAKKIIDSIPEEEKYYAKHCRYLTQDSEKGTIERWIAAYKNGLKT